MGLKFFFPPQLWPNGCHHSGEAGHAAQHIGHGLCQEYAGDPQVKDRGQEDSQGEDDKGFAQQGKENGMPGFAQGDEGGLARQLQRHEEEAEEINLHGGCADFDQEYSISFV